MVGILRFVTRHLSALEGVDLVIDSWYMIGRLNFWLERLSGRLISQVVLLEKIR